MVTHRHLVLLLRLLSIYVDFASCERLGSLQAQCYSRLRDINNHSPPAAPCPLPGLIPAGRAPLYGHVLGPRSEGTTGAALGQGLGLS